MTPVVIQQFIHLHQIYIQFYVTYPSIHNFFNKFHQMQNKSIYNISLRALYGEQLFANNVQELDQIFQIIKYLKINQYFSNIIKYIVEHQQLMDSFQLIQFCFNKHILQQKIKQHHFNLKLTMLASTKNYLQLSKISQNTINSLLLQYSQLKGQEADQTINSIIENYFGRNQIRPNDYFSQPELQPLLAIWQKYHHSINCLITAQEKARQFSQEVKKSMMLQANPLTSTGQIYISSPSIMLGNSTTSAFNQPQGLKYSYQGSLQSTSFQQQLAQRQNKIKQHQNNILLQKQIIENLQQQIMKYKTEQLNKKQLNRTSSEQQIKDAGKKSNKNITPSGCDSPLVNMSQPAVNKTRKIVNEQTTEVRTMNKLNQRTRKIFS